MYFIFCLFMSLFLPGIVAVIIYFITRPLIRRWEESGRFTAKQYIRMQQLIGAALILLAIWTSYSAAFPGRSFYASEFKMVTGVELPASAQVNATAFVEPDLHGHECIAAKFTLFPPDYKSLLQTMEHKTEMAVNVPPQDCSTLRTILRDTTVDKINYGFRRKNQGASHHTLYIGFYANDTSVVIHHCNSYSTMPVSFIRR